MNEEGQVAELENEMTDDQAVVAEESTGQPVDFTPLVASLVVKRNGAETEENFVVNSPCVIGRFDPTVGPIDIDLGNLPEGVYVSRKHAKITESNGVWKIHDMGSSNGTFVLTDDFLKVEEHEIVDGTEIALGNARFVFHLG